ncbi:hypothetical protein BOX15_Mlig014929g3 [Macrostomum lignano]|uniref:Uncharacterized protein n=1 Tax=Macrostomum lignano TaxID=282301 RepID=A0A267GCI5_9PLAT|nr:hypothetical protein BOX15_Mlig014929g3 [Macrostomum lignano]
MAESAEGEDVPETPAEIDQPLLYESFNLPDIQCSVPQSASSSTGVERENTESADIAPRRRFQSDFQRHASLRAVIEATHRRLADGFDEMQLAMSSADEMPMPVPWRLGDVDIGAQFESTATLRAEQRLLVFGGPTSGKSGLINRLLGEDIMPIGVGSLLLCQAGLTHLHFSERPFVRFSGSAFPNQPPVELDPSRPLAGQVRAFLLSDDFEPQRSAWASMDGCALEIGAPMELMRCQLAFVEVPSDCVDHLVRERLLRELARSKNHTVVYVIDSQKGFCNQDREFLLFLRANRPEDRVIYIVNKVDYDPEAEFMDCNTDDEDSNDEDEQSDEICSVHRSGEETQQRKLRLVNDQLLRYRLVDPRSGVDGRARSVFPISLIRLRVPLTASGSKSLVHRLNRQYRVQYGELQEALFSNLLETSSAGVDGAIGLLFLKASLAFDAFARDPAKEEAESRGPAAKDLVRIAVSEARDAIEQLKRKLKNDITKLHQACEESIISECGNLEFGPLRLHNRIRNNEVEQQYRTQLHNFALHLLNSEVSSRLVDCLANLRSSLALLIGKMQSQLTKESTEAGGFVDSQWNEVVRLQTQEAQCVAARMDQLSIEWEGDFKFFTWMRRLVAKKGQASGGAVFSTSEWKESVAKDFYQHINLSAVVKKFFANLEAKLLQTERRLQGLAASRQRCGTRLRRLLRKNHPGACAAWRAAQRCLATADALRNAQRFGLVDLGEVLYDGRLGCQRALVREDFGGSCVPGLQAATVLRPDSHLGSICSLYLGQRRQRRWLLPNEWTVAPILVSLTREACRMCVLHNAYTCSLADALQNGKYSNKQAFWLLQSLLQLCQICAAAAAAESGTNGDDEGGCEQCSWLTCDTVRVRFETGFATAMIDCLDEPLQVTRSKKRQQQQQQQQQPQQHQHALHRPPLVAQQSATVQHSPFRQIKEAYKRSRSVDALGDGPSSAGATSAVATEPGIGVETPWERRELDNFLLLALMILCRRRLDYIDGQLIDWFSVSSSGISQQQQQHQLVSEVALQEHQVGSLSELLAGVVKGQERSGHNYSTALVIPEPWRPSPGCFSVALTNRRRQQLLRLVKVDGI